MAEESTTVGSITGELKLDISQWVREIDRADAKAKELEGSRATLEIRAEARQALEAIDEVEAGAEELDATTAHVGVEVDTARAEAKLEETRALAAKPIVQRVEIVTDGAMTTSYGDHGAGGFAGDSLRPAAMGSTSQTGMMAAEQLAGANGDLVASYRAVEAAAVSVSSALTDEQAKALDLAVAKIQAANAEKSATSAEKAYVDVLADERSSSEAIAAAEAKAVEARQAAGRAAGELTTVLKEAGAAEEDLGRKATGAAEKTKSASTDWRGALIGGLVAVASAAPPVAAGLLGITAGVAGLGVGGALALLGMRAEMKANTAEGQRFRGVVSELQSDVGTLEESAARSMFPGLQAATAELDAHMPSLSREAGQFASELGGILPTGVDAVATALERSEPLLNAAAQGVASFVTGLDGAAHSQGFQSFLDYLLTNLPVAEQFLGDVGHTAGDFLRDWSEMGGPALGVVDGLVNGLDAILNVTGPLLPASIALFGAWKASAAIGSVLGAGLDIAKTAMVGLGLAAETTTAEIATEAIAEDVATDGLNLIPQAAAAAGGAALLAGVGIIGATAGSSSKSPTTAPAAKPSSNPTGMSGGDMSYNGFGGSAAAAVPKIDAVTAAENRSAAAAVKLATDTQAAVTKMLGLAQAGQTLESTANAVGDAEAALSKAIKSNGTSLDQNSAKGRANREATLSVASAITDHAKAIDSDGKHALQAKAYVLEHARSLEQQMVSAGMDRKEVDKLVGSLLDVSRTKPVTKVDVQTAQAEAAIAAIRAHMNNLNGTAATVYVNAVASGISTGRAAQIAKNAGMANGGTAGIPGAADGVTAGTIHGAGNAAADLAGVYRLANGEEVTSDKFGQASTFRPVLKAIGSQQVRTIDDLAEMLGAGRRGAFTAKTVNVGGVHLHNAVAESPVESAENASQLIGAYAEAL